MTVQAPPTPTRNTDLITREELQRAVAERDIALVMTLGPTAFARSHIPGSLNYTSYEALAADLSPDDEIIVYCADENCRVSRYALEGLRHRGFRRVRRYAGGIRDWGEAELPVATGEDLR